MKDNLQESLFSPSAMWIMWLTLRSSDLVHIPLPTEASHQLVNYSSASFCAVQQIDFNFLWAVNLLKTLFLLQLRWGRRCSWRTSGTMTLQGCHQSVCWGIFCSTWTDIMGGSWALQMMVSSLRFPYCLAAVSGGIRQEEVPAGCTLWYYSPCSIIWIITGFVVPVRVSAYQDLSIGVAHSASSHRWMELVRHLGPCRWWLLQLAALDLKLLAPKNWLEKPLGSDVREQLCSLGFAYGFQRRINALLGGKVLDWGFPAC